MQVAATWMELSYHVNQSKSEGKGEIPDNLIYQCFIEYHDKEMEVIIVRKSLALDYRNENILKKEVIETVRGGKLTIL